MDAEAATDTTYHEKTQDIGYPVIYNSHYECDWERTTIATGAATRSMLLLATYNPTYRTIKDEVYNIIRGIQR